MPPPGLSLPSLARGEGSRYPRAILLPGTTPAGWPVLHASSFWNELVGGPLAQPRSRVSTPSRGSCFQGEPVVFELEDLWAMVDKGRRPRRVMTTEIKRCGSLAADLVLSPPRGRRHGEWAAQAAHLDSHAAGAATVLAIATGPSVSMVQCRLPMIEALSVRERALTGGPTQCHRPI